MFASQITSNDGIWIFLLAAAIVPATIDRGRPVAAPESSPPGLEDRRFAAACDSLLALRMRQWPVSVINACAEEPVNPVENPTEQRSPPAARNGGQLLVDQLLVHGVTHAFCVPGESYLPVLDALYTARDRIALTVCRQEGGAANMAEAWGKLGGGPGICFVTRGPGATNAAVGIHTAQQDSTPLILFVGQVGSDFVEREAFQEVDYRRMYGGIAKWVASIDRADRIPELVAQAFHVAMSGRPGPVVLALPEDALAAVATVADARPYIAVQASPGAAQMKAMHESLAAAQRPLLLLGSSFWTEAGRQSVARYAHRHGLPVACAWRFQDAFDNCDSHYVG
jgi:acetolactate synthase-1/2/3 large subunit